MPYLLAGTTATTPHRFATLVAATVLGSLAGESVGYLLGRRRGVPGGSTATGWAWPAWAVLAAALAIQLLVRAARRGSGRPERRVGPRRSARSQPQHVHPSGVHQGSRVELPLGGRNERHHTAA